VPELLEPFRVSPDLRGAVPGAAGGAAGRAPDAAVGMGGVAAAWGRGALARCSLLPAGCTPLLGCIDGVFFIVSLNFDPPLDMVPG
jgi:hypothetical protein